MACIFCDKPYVFFSGYGKAIKEVRFGASKRLLVFVGNGGIYYRAGGTETKNTATRKSCGILLCLLL